MLKNFNWIMRGLKLRAWEWIFTRFPEMCKNGQKCPKTSSKSTEWDTKIHEIRILPENSHAWKLLAWSIFAQQKPPEDWSEGTILSLFEPIREGIRRGIVLFIIWVYHFKSCISFIIIGLTNDSFILNQPQVMLESQ